MVYQKIWIILIAFLLLFVESGISQESGAVYRRTGILNGNRVKTVFGNWGVIGQPQNAPSRGAWIYDNNGYIGDVSLLVGAEVKGRQLLSDGSWKNNVTFHWVIDCPVDRPSLGMDFSRNNTRQAFEPVRGYFNESGGRPAISSDLSTWPSFWPDIADPTNPRYDVNGWAGKWNGLFGPFPNADMETYFVMDDNADNEFNSVIENGDSIQFVADPADSNRHGLDLQVRVRGLQWQQILAQDNIFWVYEIKNEGKTLYNKTVFGMLVGTYVGVTGGEDFHEYDDDWSFFDVQEDLTYTGDFPNDNSRNPFWIGPVGLVGYAFLESPGNPFDGIDNDNDADEAPELPTAPLFTENDFSEKIVTNSPVPGPNEINKIVTISQDTLDDRGNFKRTVRTFPASKDTFVVVSMGDTIMLVSGVTRLVEGNVVRVQGRERVNDNALDGKDNDLDGLIDENYFLHYRQRRTTAGGQILFDILNPVHHVDYIRGIGLEDAMIDERRDDGVDNDGDWSRNPDTGQELRDEDGNLIDDVGLDGQPNTNDLGENDGVPSPGEPNFDQTDKDESDQIGLTSFDYFTPANEIPMSDDELMWDRLRPGFFDVPESIQNGRPIAGEDGDFTYSSGYFPLTPGQTERLSLALIYAWSVDEMVEKLATVRTIYNADYRFPIAPIKPTIRVVAGDDSVVIYWDRAAEESFDPILREFDFEGYKVFKSTDPLFNDARTITNSDGSVVADKAEAIFDLKNGIQGWYYAPYDIYQKLKGWAFNFGDDSKLRHSYVDYDVKNGRTYYYAVVSYDRGTAYVDDFGQVVDTTGVIPSESTKQITQLSTGEFIFDVNTAAATPRAAAAGYSGPKTEDQLEHTDGGGSGSVSYQVIDPTALTGNEYEIYFWDTSNDGIDNNGNWTLQDDVGADGIPNTHDLGEDDRKPTPGEPDLDYRDPKELESITTHYAVKDLTEYKEDFTSKDTNFVQLQRKNLVKDGIILQNALSGDVVTDSLFEVDTDAGRIRGTAVGSLPGGQYTITYRYNPVYFSPFMQGSIWFNNPNDKPVDTDIFDGITLNFDNIWVTEPDTSNSGWNDNRIEYSYNIAFEPLNLPPPVGKLEPVFFPSSYEMRIHDSVVDTTSDFLQIPSFPPTPRKFEIVNVSLGYNIEFVHNDNGQDGIPNTGDIGENDLLPSLNERIIFLEKDPVGKFTVYTWQFQLTSDDSTFYSQFQFKGGDVLTLAAKFPFNKFDRFRLKTELPQVEQVLAQNSLDEIKVVPNPYIVAHEFEPPLPPGVTSGRGERRLYFTHLPQDAKVHIFTTRGEHLITLQGGESMFNGTLTWNMKTKENLDIAFGVYFYVVDSPVGQKRGKFAVIK